MFSKISHGKPYILPCFLLNLKIVMIQFGTVKLNFTVSISTSPHHTMHKTGTSFSSKSGAHVLTISKKSTHQLSATNFSQKF